VRELSRQIRPQRAPPLSSADIQRANSDLVRQTFEASFCKSYRGPLPTQRQGIVAADGGRKRSLPPPPLGRIDVLINNARSSRPCRRSHSVKSPSTSGTRDVRAMSPAWFSERSAVLAVMRQQSGGSYQCLVDSRCPTSANYRTSCVKSCDHRHDMPWLGLGPLAITVNCIRPGGVATRVDRVVNPTSERRILNVTSNAFSRGMVSRILSDLQCFFQRPPRFIPARHRLRRRHERTGS